MRHTSGSTVRRIAALAVSAAFLATLIVPTAASAVTYPRTTLSIDGRYQVKAHTFRLSGKLPRSTKGKSVTIEIRKPGRVYWSKIAAPRVGTNGWWSWKYAPKLGGKFYIRARYGTRLSRTIPLTVKRGPGVKYVITLASTTSTKDSGLFERLGPAFLHACPEYSLKALFVGSGTAIAYGGSGDADVLLTHSPTQEVDFMNGLVAGVASKYKGKNRHSVMYNDYVLVGPKTSNPAGVLVGESASSAFQKIATTGSTFYSRNDKSGTNTKEKAIWAALNPANPQTGQSWYKASGVMGMAQALAAANDGGALGYTLSDRATWLNIQNLGVVPNLDVVNEGDATYFNQYSVIEVAGARQWDGAMDFSNWIRSAEGQALIKSYGEYTFPGKVMFKPNAGLY
ncbi:MAG: substrate-binding domain-containing protein [Coriobacteriia bacterium]|nr:substrate-binding domain-containing protein [Coriobacteriia bacterium]